MRWYLNVILHFFYGYKCWIYLHVFISQLYFFWKLFNKFTLIGFFCSIGIWTQGLHHEPLHQPVFVMGFFEIGSCKLFAQAGLELWSSWSLPPE
jgi:hypothetical protein